MDRLEAASLGDMTARREAKIHSAPDLAGIKDDGWLLESYPQRTISKTEVCPRMHEASA